MGVYVLCYYVVTTCEAVSLSLNFFCLLVYLSLWASYRADKNRKQVKRGKSEGSMILLILASKSFVCVVFPLWLLVIKSNNNSKSNTPHTNDWDLSWKRNKGKISNYNITLNVWSKHQSQFTHFRLQHNLSGLTACFQPVWSRECSLLVMSPDSQIS